ncbi:MAG TPA: UDP-3-O-(3-hydroxymyristoyl)glucosamine N-acyltransferase, partial [Planctomycetota bacterium]|nr:UDP-3-O-(3-hydroxymyristoyl)glucosamine N-acyltransferase [Planctomycetota bacterium]
GQSGVAGSSHLGRWVILAGQVGVSGHLRLGDGARVGGGSKVYKDIPAGETYIGSPAGPMEESLRTIAFLPRIRTEFRKLKERIEQLESRP